MVRSQRPSHIRNTEPTLDSQVSYTLGVPLIYLKGELGHDSAEHLRSVIEQEMAAYPEQLILDFSELLFIDSGGLSIMFSLVRRFSGPGCLGVVGAKEGVARLLEATGLADQPNFRIFANAASAATALAQTDPPAAPG